MAVVNQETVKFTYREVDKVKKEIVKAMKDLGYDWLKWEDLFFPEASIRIFKNNMIIDGAFSMVEQQSGILRTKQISPICDKLKMISGIVPNSVIFSSMDNQIHFACSFPLSKMNSGNWLRAFSG